MNPVPSCIVHFHWGGLFGRAFLSLWVWCQFRNRQDVTAGALLLLPFLPVTIELKALALVVMLVVVTFAIM